MSQGWPDTWGAATCVDRPARPARTARTARPGRTARTARMARTCTFSTGLHGFARVCTDSTDGTDSTDCTDSSTARSHGHSTPTPMPWLSMLCVQITIPAIPSKGIWLFGSGEREALGCSAMRSHYIDMAITNNAVRPQRRVDELTCYMTFLGISRLHVAFRDQSHPAIPSESIVWIC